jgi:hypothetical protein
MRFEDNTTMFLTIQMCCDIPPLGLLDPKKEVPQPFEMSNYLQSTWHYIASHLYLQIRFDEMYHLGSNFE